MRSLILAIACLALAAGCGGGDESGTTIPGSDSGNGSGTADVAAAGDTAGGGGADVDPRGKLNGPCYGNGTCDAGLECRDGICLTPADQGFEGGPCFPNGTCMGALECEDGVCVAVPQGEEGGPCRPDDTCDAGLVCVDGVCVAEGAQGEENGPCNDDGTCNPGLVCVEGVCQVPEPGEYPWEHPCTPGGEKLDGQTCTEHCECESGYCYDEGYLNGFRFCTRRCDGAHECASSEDGLQTYDCVGFYGSWVDDLDPPIHLRNFCAPGCVQDGDCEALDPAWDDCSFDTQWDGHTIGGRTCIVYGG